MPARRMCCLHSMHIGLTNSQEPISFSQAMTPSHVSAVCLCGHGETIHASSQPEPARLPPHGGCSATGCLGFQAVSEMSSFPYTLLTTAESLSSGSTRTHPL